MPTYEYLCVDCGDRAEAFQSFSDPPLEICTVCGGKLRKVYHPVGIQFKGGGFYRSDARSSPAAARDGEAEGKPEAKTADPASKTEGPERPERPGKTGKTEKAEPAASRQTAKKVTEKSA